MTSRLEAEQMQVAIAVESSNSLQVYSPPIPVSLDSLRYKDRSLLTFAKCMNPAQVPFEEQTPWPLTAFEAELARDSTELSSAAAAESSVEEPRGKRRSEEEEGKAAVGAME